MDESPLPSSSSTLFHYPRSRAEPHSSSPELVLLSSSGGDAYDEHAGASRQHGGMLLDESADFVGDTSGLPTPLHAAHLSRPQAAAQGHPSEGGGEGEDAADAEQSDRTGLAEHAQEQQHGQGRKSQAENGDDGAMQDLRDQLGIVQLSEAEKADARAKRRKARLTQERDGLARMNTMLERALAGLENAVPKVERMQDTIQTTHDLLDTYVRMMSQAEHTQRLLLDPEWTVSKDAEQMQAIEAAAERARLEEQERIEREWREREDQERREREEAERKAYLAANPPKAGRGRGATGGARGGRGASGIGAGRGRATTSSTSGIGRGRGSTASARAGTSKIRGGYA